MNKYTVIDLFAGVGGLSYGFSHTEAFNILMANEIDKETATAYAANHPYVRTFNCDIKNMTEELIKTIINDAPIDAIIGGPPCQSYSTLGKRQLDDRARLFLQYKRILSAVKPRAFLFENVTGILNMDNGDLFKSVKREFEELGYELKHKVLNAADYGVPQIRERVILVGFLGRNTYRYPEPTHGSGLKPYVTFGDALCDLPSLGNGDSNNSDYVCPPCNEFLRFVRQDGQTILTEHRSPKNNANMVRLMQALKDGQGRDDLPDELKPKSGYGNTYAKLWWDRPSTTITRNFSCPSSSRCIHPRDSRALSIREGARLQSFPDDYLFRGSDSAKRLQIGNAVPPLLSIALAKQMLEALK